MKLAVTYENGQIFQHLVTPNSLRSMKWLTEKSSAKKWSIRTAAVTAL